MIQGVVGARPNMMKMAPLARAQAEDGTFELRLIHKGQHYDEQMSEVFFRELGLPVPEGLNFKKTRSNWKEGAQNPCRILNKNTLLNLGI